MSAPEHEAEPCVRDWHCRDESLNWVRPEDYEKGNTVKQLLRLTKWAGPLTIGSFGVVAVTGILMFFHLNTGLMKLLHEWMSLLFVLGAIAHIAVNWRAFLGYFRKPVAIIIIAVPLALGALSFLPEGSGSSHRPPFAETSRALEQSSLSVVARVVKHSPESLMEELKTKGIRVRNGEQTIREIASENSVRSMEVLGHIFNGQEERPGNPSRG